MLSISRIFKVVFGVVLLCITLFAADTSTTGVILYSLVALPFVFAGMFDWRPMQLVSEKLADSLSLLTDSGFAAKK